MNKTTTTLLTLGIAGLVDNASAQWLISSFTLQPKAVIPDANPVGWMGQVTVNGLEGPVANIQVTLDISGGYNGDLYAYLSAPEGQMSVLLNRPGVTGTNPFGYSDAGFSITLDSAAANNIHDYGANSSYGLNYSGQVTGTWGADGRNIDPQSVGLAYDLASTAVGLDIFTGLSGTALNGTWTIFIADSAGGGGAPTLNSVGLQVATVPEPQTWLLLMSGGLGFLWLRRLRRNS